MQQWMSGDNFLKMWRNEVPLVGVGNCNIKRHLVSIFVFYKSQSLSFYPLQMICML